jgi:hypothetical protein
MALNGLEKKDINLNKEIQDFIKNPHNNRTKRAAKNKEETVQMNLQIPAKLKRKFQIKALSNNTDMTKVIVDYIYRYVDK